MASLPRVRQHRASKPQGSSERVLPWQVTMNQLICASLSHSRYWYEVGMLKVHIEGRLNEGPRLQRKHRETKTKQNKTNVTPEKNAMTSAIETPGGYKFAPLVASQQGRANQHEPACFGLSSSWSFPSRSGIPPHAVVRPWFSLPRSISP